MTDHACTRETFVQTTATVTHQEPASSRYYLLRLRCPEIARRVQPGQFVMLACAPDIGGRSEPLLPRPLAILDARGDEIELLYFVAGFGTEILRATAEASLLASLPKSLRIIGPLGRGFEPIPNVDVHVALGGGSGVAPLVFFFRKAATSGSWHLILAARNAEQLVREDVIRAPGKLHRATDDGSAGFRGNAVQAVEALLAGELNGQRVGLYAAGPEPMMEAAARIGMLRLNSIERHGEIRDPRTERSRELGADALVDNAPEDRRGRARIDFAKCRRRTKRERRAERKTEQRGRAVRLRGQ